MTYSRGPKGQLGSLITQSQVITVFVFVFTCLLGVAGQSPGQEKLLLLLKGHQEVVDGDTSESIITLPSTLPPEKKEVVLLHTTPLHIPHQHTLRPYISVTFYSG